MNSDNNNIPKHGRVNTKFASLLNSVGIWEWCFPSNDVFFSVEWKQQLGFSDDEIINNIHEWESRCHPDDYERIRTLIRINAQQQNRHFSFQYRMKDKDNSFLLFETNANLIYGNDDTSYRIIFSQTVNDSTIEHEAINEENTNTYKLLFQTSQDGIHVIDKNGNLKEWNNAFLNHLGYTAEEAERLNIKDWDVKYSFGQLNDFIQLFLHQNGSFESIHKRKDGTLRLVEGIANKVVINGEELVCASVHDVTLQKNTEQLLRENEARFHSMISNTSDLIIIVDCLGFISFCTPSIYRILGYTSEEVIGKNHLDFVHPDDLNDLVLKLNFRVNSSEKIVFPTKARCKHKNGSWRMLEGLGQNLIDDPNIKGIIINIRDITESEEAQSTLLATSKRLTTLIEEMNEGILFENIEGKIVLVNQTFCSIFNIPLKPSDLVGVDCHEAALQSKTAFCDPEEFIIQIENNIKAKTNRFCEELRMVNGKILERDYIPIFTSNVQQGNLWIYRDVTLRNTMEAELLESRELYRGLSEASFEAIFLSEKGICVGQNLSAENMFGFTSEEALGRYGTEWIAPQDRELVMKNMLTGYQEPYEALALRKDGSTFPCILHGKMMNFKGKVVRVTSLRDISKQKQAEDNLKNTENKFQILLENAPDGIALVKERNFKYVSPTGLKMFGYTQDCLDSLTPNELTHPDDLPLVLTTLHDIIADPSFIPTIQYRFKHRNGIWIWIESTFTNMLSNPCVDAIVINFRNITEHKIAEHERQRLSTAVDQAYEAILITDPSGIIQYVNPSFEISSGYCAKELIGKKPSILKSNKQDDAFYNILWKTILSGKTWKGTIVNKRKDGTLYNEEVTITPITNKLGELINFVAVKRDITNELNLESQLLQSQKLESLGILAGGVAHDFNNILGIILGYSNLIESQRLNVESFNQSLSTIIKASQRGAMLVKQLLTFARKSETVFKPFQMNAAISEVTTLMSETFPKTISIITQLDNNLPYIYADSGQIHQMLLNLCINARDAMEKGGVLTVSTKVVQEQTVTNHISQVKSSNYVEVIIKDTGVGIDDAVRDRIFEPFFTTKELGKGTGLGLSLVYGIVNNHDGIINVKSASGEGTEFHLYFPVHYSDSVPVEGITTKSTEGLNGNETILLIEDEEMLHSLLKLILLSRGYKVLLATDGIEGIKKYQENMKGIDIVISDIGLPLLSGEEVFEKIKTINPDAKIILSSGFIEPDVRTRLLNAGAQHFVGKPYDTIDLLTKIRGLLDGKINP